MRSTTQTYSFDEFRDGKTHRDENFPVASLFLGRRNRQLILNYYRFARFADNIADSRHHTPQQKRELLHRVHLDLHEPYPSIEEVCKLVRAFQERNLSLHFATDLLRAFMMDTTKNRYSTWEELLEYCRYSANPVGQFMLAVHGESHATQRVCSDALCTALQIINHVQDCQRDFLELNRIYLPKELMNAHHVQESMLADRTLSPELRAVIDVILERVSAQLKRARELPSSLKDRRFALELRAVYANAEHLYKRLLREDLLYRPVKLRVYEIGILAMKVLFNPLWKRRPIQKIDPHV